MRRYFFRYKPYGSSLVCVLFFFFFFLFASTFVSYLATATFDCCVHTSFIQILSVLQTGLVKFALKLALYRIVVVSKCLLESLHLPSVLLQSTVSSTARFVATFRKVLFNKEHKNPWAADSSSYAANKIFFFLFTYKIMVPLDLFHNSL